MTITKRKYSPSISLIEPPKKDRPFSGSLLMQGGKGNFSYAVYDNDNSYFSAVESFNLQGITNSTELGETIRDIIRANDNLTRKFKSVTFSYISNRSTLVPNTLYDDSKKESFLSLNHFSESGDLIFSDRLTSPASRNLFYLPSSIERNLVKLFPGIAFKHQSTLLIENFISLRKSGSDAQVFIHIQADQFEIVVAENNSLKLFNSFRYQSTEDFIYFILFVFRQLKLDVETVKVELFGEVERGSAMFGVLQKYIREVSFGRLNAGLAPTLQKLPAHFFFSLFSSIPK